MDFMSTLPGSYAGPFYPQGWDYHKINTITGYDLARTLERQLHWHADFDVDVCDDGTGGVETMNAKMGYEIFTQIQDAAQEGRELALILPVGPMACTAGSSTSARSTTSRAATCTASTWTSGPTRTATAPRPTPP